VLAGRHCRLILSRRAPSTPGEFHPEPLTEFRLEPSIHPARAIQRELPPSTEPAGSPVSSWPFMVPTRIACLNRSTDITPLYATTGQSAPRHRIRTLVSCSVHLWLLRLHRYQGSRGSLSFLSQKSPDANFASGPFPSPLTTRLLERSQRKSYANRSAPASVAFCSRRNQKLILGQLQYAATLALVMSPKLELPA